MKSLNNVEPETTVIVKEITGGLDTKQHLDELGVQEGVELTVVATEPVHVHGGPISLSIRDQELIIARGWADKIYVELGGDVIPLLRLEAGDKGTVQSIEGGKDFTDFLAELGITDGSELTFLRHVPDHTIVFMAGDERTEIRMGEGQASKLIMVTDGKSVQANYIKDGETATVKQIIGGTHLVDKFDQIGLKPGAKLTLLKKDAPAPSPARGTYVLARIEDQLITIGHGLSEKMLVE
ncbi:MAG: ferrous iron transport protein A [Methanosarcinales archaeon]|nr:MAG: ferrous iron transport protein A [Methanosarcinales archaeon]